MGVSGMHILVTGGAGFIGSHVCVELLQKGCNVLVIDNLCVGQFGTLEKVSEITGVQLNVPSTHLAINTFSFRQVDLRDKNALHLVFAEFKIDAVMHFAGLKAVGESFELSLEYYETNVLGTINLLNAMKFAMVKEIIFSSTASVYYENCLMPINEDCKLSVTNPYSRTKLFIEDILRDIHHSDPSWRIVILRYFNPIGAHHSGLIGEDPKGIPNNLMPYISRVAAGKLDRLSIFGNDYVTRDGTGVRDYIHVVDLAKGHIAALEHILSSESEGICIVNLGRGKGVSVFELLFAFEKASGQKVPYQIVGRRAGDVAEYYADVTYAHKVLNWKAELGLDRMCEDVWRFQSQKGL